MIEKLLPLTKNKMEILKTIYEKEETHLLEISKELKLHPFSAQKTLSKLKFLLNERKAGRTILVSFDKTQRKYMDLAETIEEYRLETKNKAVNSIIKHMQNMFSGSNVLACCLFGSYAMLSFTKESDIDILLVLKTKSNETKRQVSRLSSVLGKNVNPIIFTEKGFEEIIRNREASVMTLKKPSQRLLITGAKYFIEKMRD